MPREGHTALTIDFNTYEELVKWKRELGMQSMGELLRAVNRKYNPVRDRDAVYEISPLVGVV